jgi:hypothetical protein
VHSIIWQNPLKHGINRVPEKFNIFLNFAQDQHVLNSLCWNFRVKLFCKKNKLIRINETFVLLGK